MTPFDKQFSSKRISLSELYNKSNIYLYSYARYAFLELLQKLTVESIYIPSFICRDMLAPINKLNIKYFFYEVNKDLNPILEEKKCDAILSVNYFGFSQDIKPFITYKEKYNAIFIEDNAHGLFSIDERNNLLGTRGDFGLLSIRKTVFIPNGAVLLVNNEKYNNINFETQDYKSTNEDEVYYKKALLRKFFIVKYFGILFVLIRRLLRYIRIGSAVPLLDNVSEVELPFNKYITPYLKKQTLNISLIDEIKRRQAMYLQVQEWADKFNIKPIFNLYDNVVPFEFAYIDNGNTKEFERYLFSKCFFILSWPDLPDEVIDGCPEFYKKIKVVPFLW